MKILVAYDGSAASERALEEVLERPWPRGSQVRLVTVIERPLSVPPTTSVEIYAPLVERVRASLREEAYQRIQAALARFEPRDDLETSYELREGSAKQGLLDAITEWEADLVVAGSRGTSGLARLVLGSVCHALVTHAPCSVEVVKEPDRAEARRGSAGRPGADA